MSYIPTYKKGDHKAICDRCGFLFKASELKKTWDGFYVCREDFETRHPQDFLKGVKDDPSVPWTRPESTDVETDTSGWADTTTDVPAGTNNNEL